MSEKRDGKDAESGVHHEPIVSETLKENASDGEGAPRSEGPLKRHGDALVDGVGTRHGEAPDQSRLDAERENGG